MPVWNDFINAEIPNAGSGKWFQIINNSKQYGVAIKNEELVISKYREKHCLQYDYLDLKIVGTDYGEWGGELKVVYPDSTEIVLKKCNVKSIFEYEGDLYFLEGLEHLYLNTGYLYQLIYDGTHFSIRECLDLKECPIAFYIFNSHLYVISSENLFSLSIESGLFKKIMIFNNFPFSAFVPNSLVVYKGDFIIGMRGGVGRIDYEKIKNVQYMQLKKI
ncbi:hypothetical protein AMS59_01915 [Lysinibacillus sp. FJAT-14745]|uniref:hypothetical protein n=1 Tax=Lysinibacillus sp. FJAT-14745 TaxID=1704289 RepID=UPI0006ABAC80|nr:hypothetical protein [Lysinibacillus sp. FJAT-14745]KOP80182.1 hypothetical protein AMS59_01915 [Lysinibacillus sp. FJAT-14745]